MGILRWTSHQEKSNGDLQGAFLGTFRVINGVSKIFHSREDGDVFIDTEDGGG